MYKDCGDWDEHFSKFMNILAQLAPLDEEVSEKEKTSKLIRSLPESFAPTAMIASLLETLEKVEQAVRAEVDRRNNPHNSHSNNSRKQTNPVTPAGFFTQGSQGKIKKNNKNNWNHGGRRNKSQGNQMKRKGKCRYCHRRGLARRMQNQNKRSRTRKKNQNAVIKGSIQRKPILEQKKKHIPRKPKGPKSIKQYPDYIK